MMTALIAITIVVVIGFVLLRYQLKNAQRTIEQQKSTIQQQNSKIHQQSVEVKNAKIARKNTTNSHRINNDALDQRLQEHGYVRDDERV